ncbi:TLD domain-containing protein 1-like [Glycine soja]|uniref:TLD domain-containing protein 1 n=1 Tax=Glycine soja TaxID=3848 RepID=A0A445LEH0_GLYSO|nr:TLD domain-containing protein 1-like [Glycine soja]RZC21563.1 TLD domain-containing protein 1 [Glycine soja]
MGNAQSPSNNDPRYVSATRAFTQKELEDLRSLFNNLANQSQSNGKYIPPSVFQSYFGFHGPLGERMFDLVTQERKDQRLTFEDLVVAKATYEKGTKDEIEEFIFRLLDVSGDNFVGRSDLETVMIAIFNDILRIKGSDDRSSSHEDIVNIFLNAANFSKHDGGGTEGTMSFEDFRSWCTHLPSVRKLLGSLLLPPDSGRPGYQIPKLLTSKAIDSNIILLRKEYTWHIGGALSHQDLEDWNLLYHSSVNGLSFNTFLGNISNHAGPTVLIIKDKEGYIYGGYASQPWERHADFYGDLKCFLFQLNPVASIFRPTGANNNLQWCAINFSSEDIPNGIGFGGRVNHLGLFISANFDQGHTFSCTTFGSPCLSKTNRILPEVIECWGVTQDATQDKNDAVKGTILERFKEDRNMLKMVGLANSSE